MGHRRRILILTADAGFGHRSAANAVAAALQGTHPEACDVQIANPLDDRRVPSLLRKTQSDYDRMVRDLPDLYRIGYRASADGLPMTLLESALTVLLFEVTFDLLRRSNPDAIVTTYPLYQAPLAAVFATTRRRVPLLTVVTDLSNVHGIWFNTVVDQLLAPTPTVRDLAIEYGIDPERVRVTGIPVDTRIALSESSPAETRAALGWNPTLTTILAVGSRRLTSLAAITRLLNHSGWPIQIVTVAGRNDRLFEQLNATKWHQPAHVYNFVDNMPAMMRAADLVICKAGGLVVTEALASGLPMLLVDTLPGQETGNAAYVVAASAGEYCHGPVDVLEAVCHWLEDDGAILAQRAENSRRLGRPNAAYEVADVAWDAAGRGPSDDPSLPQVVRQRLVDWLARFNVKLQGA